MTNSTTQDSIWKRIIIGTAALLFWIGVWELVAVLVNKAVVISDPITVFARLFELAKGGEFWLTIFMSAVRIFLGFLLGVACGVLLAVLTSISKAARAVFAPLMSVIKATPVASFIIMLIFFSDNNSIPTVTSFLMVTPLIWANTFKGIGETDVKLLEMARVYELSLKRRLIDIYIPSVRPYFVPAVLTSLGFAWKSGIAAEVLAAPDRSIGGMLYNAKVYLENADMLAWTVCVIAVSMLLEWGLKHLLKSRVERSAAL